MTHTKRFNSHMNGRLAFFQEFLRHPLQIGSVIPSSRFLEQRVLEAAGVATARSIVELGPGMGGTTQAILRAMPQDARLLSVEINPLFHAMVSSIEDERLIAHLGSACDLREIVSQYQMQAPTAVISGIPFSTMDRNDGCRVLEAVTSILAPNGCFVAYQVSSRVASLCRPYLGQEQIALEPLNIPPMRIYRWRKKGA